jgi:accessory gene regulator B
MINSLSFKIARNIKNVVPEHPRSVEVLQYAISFILNSSLIIVFTLMISLFTGKLTGAILSLLAFALLRKISGGHHLKDGLLCIILSTTVLTLITYSSFGQTTINIINIINVLLTGVFSTMMLESTIPKKYYPLLKSLSILLVASNFIFDSSVLAMTFFAQCITLIPLFPRKGGEYK